jgi:DNA-binding NtrC family response regulator
MTDSIRLLLVGSAGSEFRLAATMAQEAGAAVTMADDCASALTLLRGASTGLVMIDVELDVSAFMAQLRAERFAVPVLACGIDAPAERAVAAIRAGARDYVPLPPQRDLIAAAISSVVPKAGEPMVGHDAAFKRAFDYGLAMAHSRAPVLVVGEKGSGKEVMARAIHDASGRTGRFLVVECAGVSAEIVESELFGHEAGAFPGAAAQRTGRIEKAAGGTLFLRDVDCLAPAAQAKLFAAIQAGAVRRLGDSAAVPLSARLIASTSSDLEAKVAEGAFRADLLARLALVRVTLPPLRERRPDTPLLANHFAERLAIANGLPVRHFTAEALALLSAYSWPGNVRELEDLVHRAVLLAKGPKIDAEAIVLIDGSRINPAPQAGTGRAEVEGLVGHTVEEVERELILQTLERYHGNRTSASNILGISVRTMRNKLKTFIEAGIPVAPAL